VNNQWRYCFTFEHGDAYGVAFCDSHCVSLMNIPNLRTLSRHPIHDGLELWEAALALQTEVARMLQTQLARIKPLRVA
jgi:hypothetical protein